MLAALTTAETTSAVTPNDNRAAAAAIPQPAGHPALATTGAAIVAAAQPWRIQPSGGSASAARG